ncbi:MAG: hypothetical protein JXB23_14625, partial [Candidatus Aminicenantes bacterium]|nr:hypothetical protein [Candidatus Aminicenantes bacterium]
MRQIAHIINPVVVMPSSDLSIAQPITFASMTAAREFARSAVNVEFYSAQFPEDRPIVPEDFAMTPDLERSVLDVTSFELERKLPLIKDILDRLYKSTSADFMIYTNVDIALMPAFFSAVDRIVADGYDAFVINRRTISDRYKSVNDLPLMYAEAGESHKGWDCFVFSRSLYPGFDTGNACIGAGWIGRVLITNMACLARNFRIFDDLHLTFHRGNEKIW